MSDETDALDRRGYNSRMESAAATKRRKRVGDLPLPAWHPVNAPSEVVVDSTNLLQAVAKRVADRRRELRLDSDCSPTRESLERRATL